MCLLCVGLAESLINPQHHTLIQFTIYSNRSLCETNAVSYEAHGDHRLRAWQIHRRSCHIDAPRQPLGDNSTGIYLTGKCTTEEKHGKSARSSKKVHPDCYVYTTSIKIAEFIFPTFDNWIPLIHYCALWPYSASLPHGLSL